MSTTLTSEAFDLRAAPLRIGRVRLRVRDLEGVSRFYRDALGLHLLEAGAASVTLGTTSMPLLDLVGDPQAAQQDPRQAGLFHTAFLMPDRAHLARWVAHAAQTGLKIDGASDHIVSEALYLADPEGNGIEVYADRPAARWRTPDGSVRMATDPLDIEGLLAATGGADWQGFPANGCIGHVHLQVGDTALADDFFTTALGFDVAARYPGASFYGSGGYHHQLAANVWNSRGAGPRTPGAAGLDTVELVARDAATLERLRADAGATGVGKPEEDDGLTLRDPWGTAFSVRAA